MFAQTCLKSNVTKDYDTQPPPTAPRAFERARAAA
ncbi:Uncharacterised protein [Moraxella atlantae]|uniref:Uncharacterized protein n=1 Tax=Faucicola atlantae TaxID=34059 RepID=A0A378Q3C2_9GAMM|nr:Uncharacterised protein [Moraxella atlantae]